MSILATPKQRNPGKKDNEGSYSIPPPFTPRWSPRRWSNRGDPSESTTASTDRAANGPQTTDKRVSFSEAVKVRSIPPRSENSSRPSPDGEDFVELRRRDATFLSVLSQSSDPGQLEKLLQNQWSVRGLESQATDELTDAKRRIKLQATLIVLLLQARGEKQKEIARQYRSLARRPQSKAHRQGLLDEMDAQHSLGDSVVSAIRERKAAKVAHSSNLKTALLEMQYNEDGRRVRL